MFERNKTLLEQYTRNHPGSQETLIDFGVVPTERSDREDWKAEVDRFLRELTSRGYQLRPAMYDGHTGWSPLHIVRLDRMDFQGPTPVDLSYFQWVVNQFCHPGQTTVITGHVIEIHILGDGASLG